MNTVAIRMSRSASNLRRALKLGAALLAALALLGVGASRAEARPKDVTGVVNLNTADEAQLRLLPGVGPSKARAILEWRAKHQKFSRPEELRRVKGFGQKTVTKLRKYLTVTGETTLKLAQAPAPGPFSGGGGATTARK
jgi:competence protein ComEA